MAILDGSKKYEFRRVIPKDVDSVSRFLMYCSSPVQKFVGEFTIDGVVSGHPDEVWTRCRDFAGINRQSFNRYFQDRELAFALSIANVHSFNPVDPWAIQPDFTPPQSFKYVRNPNLIECLRE